MKKEKDKTIIIDGKIYKDVTEQALKCDEEGVYFSAPSTSGLVLVDSNKQRPILIRG